MKKIRHKKKDVKGKQMGCHVRAKFIRFDSDILICENEVGTAHCLNTNPCLTGGGPRSLP